MKVGIISGSGNKEQGEHPISGSSGTWGREKPSGEPCVRGQPGFSLNRKLKEAFSEVTTQSNLFMSVNQRAE